MSETTKRRRNVEAQERAIGVLHTLVRDHQHPEEYPHQGSSRDYTFSLAAMGKALDGIMEAFGYAVTEIQ